MSYEEEDTCVSYEEEDTCRRRQALHCVVCGLRFFVLRNRHRFNRVPGAPGNAWMSATLSNALGAEGTSHGRAVSKGRPGDWDGQTDV